MAFLKPKSIWELLWLMGSGISESCLLVLGPLGPEVPEKLLKSLGGALWTQENYIKAQSLSYSPCDTPPSPPRGGHSGVNKDREYFYSPQGFLLSLSCMA